MAWTQAKTAIAVGAGILLAAGTTTVLLKEAGSDKILPIHEEILRNPDESSSEKLKIAPPVLVIRPAQNLNNYGGVETGPGRKVFASGSLPDILSFAYNATLPRMILPADLPAGKFDFLNTLGDGYSHALQERIKRQFGLVAHREIRDTDVLLLKVKDSTRLASHLSQGEQFYNGGAQQGNVLKRILTGQNLAAVAQLAEDWCELPTLDETGMSGDYDFTYQWTAQQWPSEVQRLTYMRQSMNDQLYNELGLELVPTNMPIEMLVVEKAK